MLLVAASSGMGLFGPYLTGRAIDEYIRPGDLPGLARLCALMIAAYLATAPSIWLQRYVMVGASQRAIQEIRNDLFAKLQTLSL
jgi:ATP-binding cassette subfamily B protein